WTAPRRWPILPFYIATRSLARLRLMYRDNTIGFMSYTLIGVAGFVLMMLGLSFVDWFERLWSYLSIFLAGIPLVLGIGTAVRKAWLGRRDRGLVVSWSRNLPQHSGVSEVQAVLQGLRTDEGVRYLFREMGRHELQNTAAIADFLELV